MNVSVDEGLGLPVIEPVTRQAAGGGAAEALPGGVPGGDDAADGSGVAGVGATGRAGGGGGALSPGKSTDFMIGSKQMEERGLHGARVHT